MLETFPLKAVLWDLDGEIADSFEAHYHAWRRLFVELDEPFTLEDFTRTFGQEHPRQLQDAVEARFS